MALPRIADFDVERELGTGAMGTVHLARRGNEAFAVKVIRPELIDTGDLVARMRREAEVGSHVVHPNVVRTLGSGTTEVGGRAVHYLVMEYVEGKDLRHLLEELGSLLPPRRTLGFGSGRSWTRPYQVNQRLYHRFTW